VWRVTSAARLAGTEASRTGCFTLGEAGPRCNPDTPGSHRKCPAWVHLITVDIATPRTSITGMQRVAIVGPGAVGCVVAAALSRHPDVSLVLAARRALDRIEVEQDGVVTELRAPVLIRPAEAPAVDWVLVATKAYDAAGAGAWLARLAAGGATVAILQNGVEHRQRFAPYVAEERLLPVVVDVPAERTGQQVRRRGAARMTVPDTAAGHAFAALFTHSDFQLTLTNDWTSAAWRKLCLNAAGVISGLLLKPAGVMADDALAETARQMVREAIAVGRAEGAVLEDELADNVVASYRRAPADAINSLHADRLAGRPTEIDARNGVIVRLGRQHGIPTPTNQMAVALMGAMD
jgi:2-dehydropantoate 2-reductase